MLTITDGNTLLRVLQGRLDRSLRQLLIDRRDQLDGQIDGEVHFVVAQPGDSIASLEFELGFSIVQNAVDGSQFGDPDFTPSFEWIQDHGHCFELCFIFDDSGFAHVLIVPQQSGVDARLIAFCEEFYLTAA